MDSPLLHFDVLRPSTFTLSARPLLHFAADDSEIFGPSTSTRDRPF